MMVLIKNGHHHHHPVNQMHSRCSRRTDYTVLGRLRPKEKRCLGNPPRMAGMMMPRRAKMHPDILLVCLQDYTL